MYSKTNIGSSLEAEMGEETGGSCVNPIRHTESNHHKKGQTAIARYYYRVRISFETKDQFRVKGGNIV
jgi:hypothetical protein